MCAPSAEAFAEALAQVRVRVRTLTLTLTRSPLELAAQLGHVEIVALFEQEEEERDAELRGDPRSV